MVTTALVVEIVVAGLLAAVWILGIPGVLLFPAEADRLLRSLIGGSSFSVILAFAVLAIAYPLGWLVNAVTSGLALITYRSPLQRRIFGPSCTPELYRELRVMLLMNSQCGEITRSLEADTSVQRIARSAGLNFLALGVLLFLGSSTPKGGAFGVIFLVCSVIFWWIAVYYHVASYKKIGVAAARLPEGSALLARAASPPAPEPTGPPDVAVATAARPGEEAVVDEPAGTPSIGPGPGSLDER